MRKVKGLVLLMAVLVAAALPSLAEEDAISRMMALDTGMTVSAYNEALEGISADAGMSVYEVGDEVLGKLDTNDPVYLYLVGILANSQQEIYGQPYVDAAAFKMETETLTEQEISRQLLGRPKAVWLSFMLDNLKELSYAGIITYHVQYQIADPGAMTIAGREANLAVIEAAVQVYADGLEIESLFSTDIGDEIQAALTQVAETFSDSNMRYTLTLSGIDSM